MKGTFVFIFSLLITTLGYSQAKTKITGKVTDATDNSPLVGATITIEGSAVATKTDVEGVFFLAVAPGKTYAIKVTNVGYQPKVVSDVQGTDSAPLTITLEKAKAEMTGIVVKANARRESVASLYTVQKNASAISDAISAEVIKKSPDRNTSEVLRRVSGTAIQDNKFVVIRGLSERYNSSQLNNAVLPSTEPDKKAFSFDILPSSLIDNITIYKSPTPDLPGDFAGGAVKITTRDYPSRPISEVSFNAGYNTLTTFKNFYKGYPQGGLDALGFFDNSRLIPGSYYKYRGSPYSNLSDGTKLAITKQFPNAYGMEAGNQSQPNFSFAYTGGNTKLLNESNKLGYIYALNYNNGRRVAERTRDEWETYRMQDYYYNTNTYDMRSSLSALLNLTYSYGKNKISLKNLFNNDFVSSFSQRFGRNVENQGFTFNYKSQNTEATQNGIFNSVLEGVHTLGKAWTIDWNGSFGATYRWQPDQHILSFVTEPNSENYFLRLNNQNSPVIKDAGRIYSFLKENIYGANLNAAKQFTWKGQMQKLKVGTANYYRDRNVEVNALGLASTDFRGATIPETKSTTFRTLLSPENIDHYGMIYAPIAASATDYTGTGLLNSGYVMLDNRFSDKVKLTWGVRAEKYLQELNTKGKAKVSLDNTDILLSMLFTYALTPKANFRAAGSQTVNRPEFRELATYRVYDYENDFIVQGNNNLVRSKNTNADLRYEWFPNPGEIISVSTFYKYFKNPIEQTNLGNDVLSFANADNATVYGVELELRKRLTFFNNAFLDHLTFYSNASLLKGSVQFNGESINSPMQGQSPYLVNGGLTYSADNDDFSFNVLYNRIGQRLKFRAASSAGRNIFEKPRDVLDLQVSKKFLNNRFETKLTVSDVFAQPFSWYYKYEANPSKTVYDPSVDKLMNTYKYGTTISLGVRYNLSK
ncbi:TonB-dependent receptor [Flavisolibacter nicotianae]|uniref:TonB-dependent receptor n=1 Tax=Flavisolibacter nicotianae TaxID=2364882 RepID=UPI000EB4A007|nr:TonB-dependent receptor [Flavisolibacter nicotianae]